MELCSPAFFIGSTIPFKYTCDGGNISPPLHWEDPPHGTNSFALILDDPDAPNQPFTHWVVYNLSDSTRELPEGITNQPTLPGGGVQGKNS
ncbi:MAG: YbhB/YbcL family Raf kinase inhibitor-like protein [Chroococcidiopsidaceae cyanobacterium CP_BM_ER_R8_30]|nr:YbhB/YbcL family Raf kinase inhibitor-like protein [Chroococcidiopsidaceae cyanobacterium CP_BM_ER_R8_30]